MPCVTSSEFASSGTMVFGKIQSILNRQNGGSNFSLHGSGVFFVCKSILYIDNRGYHMYFINDNNNNINIILCRHI